MINLCIRLIRIFGKQDRARFVLLFLGILLNSVLEIVGIGFLFPFIALLGHPELMTTNLWLSRVFQAFHFQGFNQFMVVMAVGIGLVFLLKNAMLFLTTFWQIRFVYEKQAYFSTRLFRAYLMSPYNFHLQRDIGRLRYALANVPTVMNGIVLQIFNILTELVLVLFLFGILFVAQPLLTGVVMFSLGSLLFLFFFFLKRKIGQWGAIARHHGILREQAMEQGLGSIKEAKLLGKELFFAERHRVHREEEDLRTGMNDALMKSIRIFIETIVVCFIMAAMVFFLMAGQAPGKILMTLSLFAIVAVRLMPSLNRISAAWGGVKFYSPIFDTIFDDLVLCEQMNTVQQERDKAGIIRFQEKIEMKDVCFFYENTETRALDSVSLTIAKNTTVGFVGSSGAGKSTAVDIILGLLPSTFGKVFVDGMDIHSQLRSWQRKIGYIPQVIYLCDDTIKSNIAFGEEPTKIDEGKVWEALRLAQLEDFVRSLPLGINTVTGERGIRISGGQRQRIGIARALYHNPEVLVMDEATAALDNETERDFMAALDGLLGGKTIVIIAHRLTTVRRCDKIFFLKEGRLIADGTYDELLKMCPQFQDMAGAGQGKI